MSVDESMAMIPAEKRDAVRVALMVAFGVETYESIAPLEKGLSTALLFRIGVHGETFLLRVIARTDAGADPTQHFACMTAGAEAGIAPRIWYESVEDRVLITDFVEAKPFPADMAERMAGVLRTLHGLPRFAAPRMGNYLQVMDGFVQRFVEARLMPDEELADFVEGYARLKGAYAFDESDMVSCHNDLKVENVLFDGERVWLVDWEACFLNDRYCDLAVVANFFVADEDAYLSAYLGEAAGSERLAKFFRMRVRMSAIYAAYFLMLGKRVLTPMNGSKPMEEGAELEDVYVLPGFAELHRRMVTEGMNLLDRRAQVEYGTVHFKQALEWMRTAQFAEALS